MIPVERKLIDDKLLIKVGKAGPKPVAGRRTIVHNDDPPNCKRALEE